MDNKNFGRTMKLLRESKNMELIQLSTNVYVSDIHLSNIERGNKVPTIRTAVDLVNVFGVGIDECLSGVLLSESVDRRYEEIKAALNLLPEKMDLQFFLCLARNLNLLRNDMR